MKVLFLQEYAGIYEVGDAIELPDEQTKPLIGAGYCKDLKAEATALGLKGFSKLNAPELRDLIREAEAAAEGD